MVFNKGSNDAVGDIDFGIDGHEAHIIFEREDIVDGFENELVAIDRLGRREKGVPAWLAFAEHG